MTAPDLKPCPFCGGGAEIWRAHEGRTAWIACMGRCAVLVSKEYTTDAEAIAAWNTRATPAAMPPEVRALVSKEAATAREVFEDYGSKAKEAIDYMEQLLLAALRAGGDA